MEKSDNIQNDLKEQQNLQNIKNDEISKKMNEIDEQLKFFENSKENYDKLFFNENLESIHLIENNLDIIDNKMEYLKLYKDFYNNKKPELDLKFQLKRQTKNMINEELLINNDENNDDYFNIKPEIINYDDSNKNYFYKSDEGEIFKNTN